MFTTETIKGAGGMLFENPVTNAHFGEFDNQRRKFALKRTARSRFSWSDELGGTTLG